MSISIRADITNCVSASFKCRYCWRTIVRYSIVGIADVTRGRIVKSSHVTIGVIAWCGTNEQEVILQTLLTGLCANPTISVWHLRWSRTSQAKQLAVMTETCDPLSNSIRVYWSALFLSRTRTTTVSKNTDFCVRIIHVNWFCELLASRWPHIEVWLDNELGREFFFSDFKYKIMLKRSPHVLQLYFDRQADTIWDRLMHEKQG